MSDSRRILVVDDDPDTVDSTVLVLRQFGHEAFAAYDGPSALQLAQTAHPQVVLVDAAMPDYDGLRLARELRRLPETKNALIICISGYGTESYRQQALEAGCDHHFLKPIHDWDEIVHLIEVAGDERGLLALP